MKTVRWGVCCLTLFMALSPHAQANANKGDSAFWLDGSRQELCDSSMPSSDVHSYKAKNTSKAPIAKSKTRQGEVAYWNELALDLIIKYQRNPLRAARILALLNTGIHDAMSCLGSIESSSITRVAAIGGVASETLEYLFPQEPQGRFQALALSRVVQSGGDIETRLMGRGWGYGKSVSLAVMKRAASDGADRLWDVASKPANRPGLWRPAPPVYSSTPVEAMAGTWRTWVLRDGGELQPPPPLEYGSDAYLREVEEVRAVRERLTVEQKRIADAWHLGNGTVTPVGVWAKEGLRRAKEASLSEAATSHLMATLSVAMMDASISCWHAKFTHWTERPVTVIQEKLDPAFMPYLVTPSFPSYVSGHATVSGAASVVLSAYFPDRAKETRVMAEEAAVSRLYGGIHFSSDNNEGLKLGRRIGERVMSLPKANRQQRRAY